MRQHNRRTFSELFFKLAKDNDAGWGYVGGKADLDWPFSAGMSE